MADVSTGTSGVLRLVLSENSTNAAANTSVVGWSLYLIEATTSNSTWVGSGITFSVTRGSTLDSGTFGFDWRGAGNQTTLISSGTTTIAHNADGTSPSVTFTGNMGATGTSGAGGPASVNASIVLTTLKVLPSVPTGVTATRVSDTQTKVSWTNGGASNGKATQNIIQQRLNGGAWTTVATIAVASTTTLTTAANGKYEYRVAAKNAAGTTAYSSISAPIYTTPAAPSSVAAVKDASLNIVVTFAENVAYSEYQHEVWHGTVSGGVTTWDGAALATLATGVLTYTHTAPNAGQVHAYQVRAKTSTGTALYSAYVRSADVQLLAPPNAPTVPAMPSTADKAQALTFSWTHNPVDSTAQTFYEFQRSTDGGATWPTTTGKTAGTTSQFTIPANTYAGNVAVTTRVRTWGGATTGGADGAGASAWSTLRTVTLKTIPTTSITTPANGSTLNSNALAVTLGFAQAESATFVKAIIQVTDAADNVLEEKTVTSRTAVPMATVMQNSTTYKVKAQVQDSNGLWSTQAVSTFSVTYLPAPAATAVATYLEDNGYGQLDLTFVAAGGGQAAVAAVSIYRDINGKRETVVENYPQAGAGTLSFLDTTPTVHGTNTYTVVTITALGARTEMTIDLVTTEMKRAFLNKGADFSQVVVFGGNLSVDETLGVASSTIQAAGRTKPVGLYGMETSVSLSVSSRIYEYFGSSIPEVRDLLLVPGKACYRDGSGRRLFGSVVGGLSYDKDVRANLSFTIAETS